MTRSREGRAVMAMHMLLEFWARSVAPHSDRIPTVVEDIERQRRIKRGNHDASLRINAVIETGIMPVEIRCLRSLDSSRRSFVAALRVLAATSTGIRNETYLFCVAFFLGVRDRELRNSFRISDQSCWLKAASMISSTLESVRSFN